MMDTGANMRMTSKKKAVNIKAICDGHISKEEVMQNLQMSEDEINPLIERWKKYGEQYGWACLNSTCVQRFRNNKMSGFDNPLHRF